MQTMPDSWLQSALEKRFNCMENGLNFLQSPSLGPRLAPPDQARVGAVT